MADMSSEQRLELLKEATQALALSYEDQKDVFPSFVHLSDELVLSFDEAFQHIGALQGDGSLTDVQAEAFSSIDVLSDAMTASHRNGTLVFTGEALKSDPIWDTMREKAREALRLMSWNVEMPAFSDVTFVRNVDSS